MKPRGKLTQAGIVEVALQMLDENGEKKFSMRKLAMALNVDPMAIYHHHANKKALLNAVMQLMMEGCEVPELSGHWQRDVRDLCHCFRRLAQKHPGTFCIYETYEDDVPAEHRLHEAFHAALLSGGFSRLETVQAVRLLLAYTEGFAVDEISGWSDPDDRDELIESFNQGPYPTLISLIDEIGTTDADANFEFGLNILIRGLEGVIV